MVAAVSTTSVEPQAQYIAIRRTSHGRSSTGDQRKELTLPPALTERLPKTTDGPARTSIRVTSFRHRPDRRSFRRVSPGQDSRLEFMGKPEKNCRRTQHRRRLKHLPTMLAAGL